MSRYAFVVPRFGESIAGGAETLIGALASSLAARGDEVAVWTTCARDNRSWENHFPEGESSEFGLRVNRFPVNHRNLDIWIPHQLSIHDGLRLSVEQQLEWMSHGVNSTGLYEHINRESDSYDCVFFAPYLFGTTFFGALIRPVKSVLIPCLHDENYAYTEIMQSLFRQVRGCLFNSSPEADLIRALYGNVAGMEVGMGFDSACYTSRRPYFAEAFPYVVYIGRKETGKSVQLLVDYFIAYKQSFPESPLRLVVAGGGDFSDLHRPGSLDRGDIIDLVHLSEEEKQSVIEHSLCLCQPSRNESFSIVVMEAWLQGAPVLVHSECPVTKHHAVESGGGLYFGSEEDFIGVCNLLLTDAELRRELATAGKRYVERRYSWQAVLERFDTAVASIFGRLNDFTAAID